MSRVTVKLGVLSSRIRWEEKVLIKEARRRKGVSVKVLDPRKTVWGISPNLDLDILLDREISQSRAYHLLELLEKEPVKVINSFKTVTICGDKAFTSAILKVNGIRTPKFAVSFDKDSALQAIERIGYPSVLKPVDGSWGRLLAKIDNREEAEAILEYKSHLNSHFHSIFYLQEYVPKDGRDIRAYVVGDETVGAAYRSSDHWITNAARGGKAYPCLITDELDQICRKTARVVGGDAIAVDLFEDEEGLMVNEINCAMEFKESQKAISYSLASKLIDYVIKKAKAPKEVGARQ